MNHVYEIQGSDKRWSLGLVNLVTALAYHFCLTLPAAYTQPGVHLLAKPCIGYLLCKTANHMSFS